jgi:hypothetical protein
MKQYWCISISVRLSGILGTYSTGRQGRQLWLGHRREFGRRKGPQLVLSRLSTDTEELDERRLSTRSAEWRMSGFWGAE